MTGSKARRCRSPIEPLHAAVDGTDVTNAALTRIRGFMACSDTSNPATEIN
jgi:hypothetical protein